MRVALKKQFLDRLSSVICHHRVRDFIYLGIPIPNTRLEQSQNRQVTQVQSPAQQPALPEPAAMPVGELEGSLLLAVRKSPGYIG